MTNWTFELDDKYWRRLKRFSGRYDREISAVIDHLDYYLGALKMGSAPQTITAGWIHSKYPKGIKSLDQKGAGPHLKQMRLYIYPEIKTNKLHVITLGDKQTQKEDVKYSIKYVEKLRRS